MLGLSASKFDHGVRFHRNPAGSTLKQSCAHTEPPFYFFDSSERVVSVYCFQTIRRNILFNRSVLTIRMEMAVDTGPRARNQLFTFFFSIFFRLHLVVIR